MNENPAMIHVLPAGGVSAETPMCPDCGKWFDSSALSGCLFIANRAGDATLAYTSGPFVHLHGVTVMPRGEERLIPTIHRTTRAAYSRLRFRIRRLLP